MDMPTIAPAFEPALPPVGPARSHVETDQQFRAAVAEGQQALREGRLVDHTAVVSAFEHLIARTP